MDYIDLVFCKDCQEFGLILRIDPESCPKCGKDDLFYPIKSFIEPKKANAICDALNEILNF